jgi:hypothetical protein
MQRRGCTDRLRTRAMMGVVALASLAAEIRAAGPVKFTEYLLQGGYGYAYGLAAGDLDGDGKPEITTADAEKGELSCFINRGAGRFARFFIKHGEPGWFERHVLGDVNGDGRSDVVVVKNLSEELLWFQNPGKPCDARPWTRHVITTGLHRSYDVCLADLNRDGWPDVAASTWVGNSFVWFENPGRGGAPWTKHVLDEGLEETRTIRAADFNGDGRIDLLGTARLGNLVVWYENPGPPYTQRWTRHVVDDRSASPAHGHPVDMDGDGDPDIVMALGFSGPPGDETHQVCWYENVGKPGKGTQWKKHLIGRLEVAFEAVAADINGDGRPDVAATAWGPNGQVVWFENPGDPSAVWTRHVLKQQWIRANSVLIVDLDGDGRPDIVASAERGANEVRWWRNEGSSKP